MKMLSHLSLLARASSHRNFPRARSAWLLSLLLASAPSVRAQSPDTRTLGAASELSPEKTWAFIVGVLEYENPHLYANMGPRTDEEADEGLYEAILDLGVPEEQVTLLLDQQATLANIQEEFSKLLGKTREGDFLITYFDGHGLRDEEGVGYFVNYDAPDVDDWSGLWRVPDIFEEIEAKFRGERILMTAGCCHSGTLCDYLRTLETDKAYACLASTQARLQSGMTWTFTETLISGLRGMPYVDGDGDGRITLDELKDHSFEEVGVFLEQEISFATNERFPSDMQLVAAQPQLHKDIGKYYEIRVGKNRGGKEAWKKAKACAFRNGMVTFAYYNSNDYLVQKTLPVDSRDIRPIFRATIAPGTAVDVFSGDRWYPARIVGIDAKTGLHRVVYDNLEGWDGLHFFSDLRLRRPGEPAGRAGR